MIKLNIINRIFKSMTSSQHSNSKLNFLVALPLATRNNWHTCTCSYSRTKACSKSLPPISQAPSYFECIQRLSPSTMMSDTHRLLLFLLLFSNCPSCYFPNIIFILQISSNFPIDLMLIWVWSNRWA